MDFMVKRICFFVFFVFFVVKMDFSVSWICGYKIPVQPVKFMRIFL